MVSITLSVPQELKTEMDKHPEFNWSEVAREAIKTKLHLLERFKEFTRESTFTEEDAIELGRKVSEATAKRYKAWKS